MKIEKTSIDEAITRTNRGDKKQKFVGILTELANTGMAAKITVTNAKRKRSVQTMVCAAARAMNKNGQFTTRSSAEDPLVIYVWCKMHKGKKEP